MKIQDFIRYKASGKKISMLTCYDFWSAQILEKSEIDTLLVGDSLSMVVYGHDSTVHADIEMMAAHTAAVRRGAPSKFIIGDMPFFTYRKDLNTCMDAVEKLMKAGANCIKLEGVKGSEKYIEHIIESGVPVMGHLGLTPQSVHGFGGHKIQGRKEKQADEILKDAIKLQELGCFSIVLECVPRDLSEKIAKLLSIPVIGIGAGSMIDGQVLVLQDMLGMNQNFKPTFLKHFFEGEETLLESIEKFNSEVKDGSYPSEIHSYN